MDHPASVKAVGHSQNDSLRRLKRKSDPAGAGMGSYDLPTVVELFEVGGGIANPPLAWKSGKTLTTR